MVADVGNEDQTQLAELMEPLSSESTNFTSDAVLVEEGGADDDNVEDELNEQGEDDESVVPARNHETNTSTTRPLVQPVSYVLDSLSTQKHFIVIDVHSQWVQYTEPAAEWWRIHSNNTGWIPIKAGQASGCPRGISSTGGVHSITWCAMRQQSLSNSPKLILSGHMGRRR